MIANVYMVGPGSSKLSAGRAQREDRDFPGTGFTDRLENFPEASDEAPRSMIQLMTIFSLLAISEARLSSSPMNFFSSADVR